MQCACWVVWYSTTTVYTKACHNLLICTCMQAWNIYLTVMLTHNPTWALELLGYQRIITSADHAFSLKPWLQYDRHFYTLAASNPSLCWDQRHLELWCEAMATTNNTQQDKKRWLHPYVGLRTTFLRIILARPYVTVHNTLNHLTSEYLDLLCEVILTMDSAQETHVISNTFTCHIRAPTPKSPVQSEQTEDRPTKASDIGFVPWR